MVICICTWEALAQFAALDAIQQMWWIVATLILFTPPFARPDVFHAWFAAEFFQVGWYTEMYNYRKTMPPIQIGIQETWKSVDNLTYSHKSSIEAISST